MSQVWQNASGIQWGENSKDPTTLCRNELTAAMHAFNRASNEEFADRSLILGLSSVRLTLANPICYMSRYISSFYWSLKNAKSNEPCWIRTSAPLLKSQVLAAYLVGSSWIWTSSIGLSSSHSGKIVHSRTRLKFAFCERSAIVPAENLIGVPNVHSKYWTCRPRLVAFVD